MPPRAQRRAVVTVGCGRAAPGRVRSRRGARWPWLTALLLLTAAAAAAQTPPAPSAAVPPDWTATLDRIDAALSTGGVADATLDRYRQTLEALIADAERHKGQALGSLEAPRSELDALGPAPKDDEPAEADAIVEQRRAIGERIAAFEARSKQSELTITRAEALLERLVRIRGDRLQQRLGTRGPSLLASSLWRTALSEAGQVVAGLAGELRRAFAAPSVSPDWPGIALALIAAGMMLFARRALLRRYALRPAGEPPTGAGRALSAFADGVGNGLIPAAVIGVLGWMIVAQTLAATPAATIVTALTAGIAFAVAGAAPIRAALAPAAPRRRLLPLASVTARRLYRRLLWLVLLCAALLAAYLASARFRPFGSELTSLALLLPSVAVTALLLSVLKRRLWRVRRGPRADRAAQTRGHLRLIAAIRLTLYAALITALGVAVVGYVDLGAFVISRIALSAVLLVGLLLLRRLLHELIEPLLALWQDRPNVNDAVADDTYLRFWLRGLVAMLLAVPAFVALAVLWGIPHTTTYLLLRQLLDGTTIGGLTLSPGRVLLAVLVFVGVFVLTRLMRRLVYERVLPYTRLDVGLRHTVYTGIGYLGLLIAAILAVAALGVSFGHLALVFGALSVGIGLGLQGVVNNFVSGLILMIQRPIKVGDWVVVGPHEGYVREIKPVATEIETFDKASVIIPNSELLTTAVVNWTHTDRSMRVIIAVGVAYEADPNQVQKLLLACAAAHDDVLDVPSPYALLVDFGDSALRFELRVFVRDVDRYLIVASELRFAIEQTLRDAGVVIPYPQRDVRLHRPAGAAAGAGAAVRPDPGAPRAPAEPPGDDPAAADEGG